MSNDESLSAARLRRGLTIPILATATGVAQHDLKAAEHGDAGALSVSEATRVGVVLGIDADRVAEAGRLRTTTANRAKLHYESNARRRLFQQFEPAVFLARACGLRLEPIVNLTDADHGRVPTSGGGATSEARRLRIVSSTTCGVDGLWAHRPARDRPFHEP